MEKVNTIAPRHTLVLAVDGVAPVAKIQQQRQRRYRSAQENVDPVFDTARISPGTPLMKRLDEQLRLWLNINKSMLPQTVIYSSYMVRGEGEHKILYYFRNGDIPTIHGGAHIVDGVDADLYMLFLV
ncbi:unnamed protein product [marine sediment metagenome]|uniref:Xrn1 N-terminal domain-containing protein n=1 Tax=marine sediment metagenome TaxID=412755 RepID=X1BT57_9ZZZZ